MANLFYRRRNQIRGPYVFNLYSSCSSQVQSTDNNCRQSALTDFLAVSFDLFSLINPRWHLWFRLHSPTTSPLIRFIKTIADVYKKQRNERPNNKRPLSRRNHNMKLTITTKRHTQANCLNRRRSASERRRLRWQRSSRVKSFPGVNLDAWWTWPMTIVMRRMMIWLQKIW